MNDITYMSMSRDKLHLFIERNYKQTAPYQWAREALINAIEANASNVHFGISEQDGVYRRFIADDGDGITSDELVKFFNNLSEGSKKIEGPEDNFGIGAKITLLPWNKEGVIVASWKGGKASAIWLKRFTDGYALVGSEKGDPFFEIEDDQIQFDVGHTTIQITKPDWMSDSGTFILLLGDDLKSDTSRGDRDKDDPNNNHMSLVKYLNTRMWDLSDIRVDVTYLDESKSQLTRRVNGARHFIELQTSQGSLKNKGSMTLSDTSTVHWFLREGGKHSWSRSEGSGYAAVLYNNELYHLSKDSRQMGRFDLPPNIVHNVYYIVEPPKWSSSQKKPFGVYPDDTRSLLKFQNKVGDLNVVDLDEWSHEVFLETPDEIKKHIKENRAAASSGIRDGSWRQQLIDRVGSLWSKVSYVKTSQKGNEDVDVSGNVIIRKKKPNNNDSTIVNEHFGNKSITASNVHHGDKIDGKKSTKERKVADLPEFRESSERMTDGYFIQYHENDPLFSSGVIYLDFDHPVLKAAIENWQQRYPNRDEVVRETVVLHYGMIAVARVAHIMSLKGPTSSGKFTAQMIQDMLSPAALTASLCGLYSEQQSIASKLGGKRAQDPNSVRNTAKTKKVEEKKKAFA